MIFLKDFWDISKEKAVKPTLSGSRHILFKHVYYSTVTDFARLRGWSTSQPRRIAASYAKSCEKEFPALQQAIKKSGVRSSAFMKAWKTYSYGDKAQEFENSQFSFMWDKVYQDIFDNLHKSGKFPKINLDNYNDPDNIMRAVCGEKIGTTVKN